MKDSTPVGPMRTYLPTITRWLSTALLSAVLIPLTVGATEPVIKFRVSPSLCIPGVLDCYNYVYTNARYQGSVRLFVLASNGVSARVVFDASESYDPDGDPLEIVWHEDTGESEDVSGFFAQGPVAINEFFIRQGERQTGMSITLSANDAPMVNFGPPYYYIHISVLSPAAVLASVREVVHDEAPKTRFTLTLQRMLTRAITKLEQGDTRRALRYLEIFRMQFDRRSIGLSSTQVDGVRAATDLIAGLLSSSK